MRFAARSRKRTKFTALLPTDSIDKGSYDMPDKPLVFISCGQFTPIEIALGNQVEQFIRDQTPYQPYFAEKQNTFDGLVTNILSALHRCAAFIGIMHHRGSIVGPDGNTLIRGSVWVEQELAICAYQQHVLDRNIAVALYIQRGISREGIRSQLRLKPVEFDTADDVLADLPRQIAGWQILVPSSPPLVAQWNWKRLPGYTGERHEYMFSVELINKGNNMIDVWKADLWFPSAFIQGADRSQPFVHRTIAETNFDGDAKRIWPDEHKTAFAVPYFVTNANWPGRHHLTQQQPPNVKIRVSTPSSQPWEQEISIMDIQKF